MAVFIGSLYLLFNPFSFSEAEDSPTYNAEEVYANAEEAVFYVRAFRSDGTLQDVGTGFLIDTKGIALTAYHVVDGADRIVCVLNDGQRDVPCELIARNENTDAAVLKLQSGTNAGQQEIAYPSLQIQTSAVKHGEKVYALGYPLKEAKIITEGIVNSPHALINGRDRLLVSAEIVNGMSGGPVIDSSGRVIGIVSGSLRTMSQIHLAVNVNDINQVIADDSFTWDTSIEKGNKRE
ncbi:hypothetical protein CF651_20335 [Paenibacillus rigui]|uniref:Serine protease n=2 Tax=Paenibacillus rigui TaxID=554312 RepID=A0A229UMF8_9BACL|nr:hypothetical protein CF651_20335 [Paenibacillus rigui]